METHTQEVRAHTQSHSPAGSVSWQRLGQVSPLGDKGLLLLLLSASPPEYTLTSVPVGAKGGRFKERARKEQKEEEKKRREGERQEEGGEGVLKPAPLSPRECARCALQVGNQTDTESDFYQLCDFMQVTKHP